MKKFVKELMTNRLGIVLAALNVCYFVSRDFVSYILLHGDGSDCFFGESHMFQWMRSQCADLMLYVNSPAFLVLADLNNLMQSVSPDFCNFTHGKIYFVFCFVFITFQWLFIGQTAKIIARAIRPNK
jgi:hypothetical protein